MYSPDNHHTNRRDDRSTQGYTPEEPSPSWLLVLAAIIAWGLCVILFAISALPLLQWMFGQGADS